MRVRAVFLVIVLLAGCSQAAPPAADSASAPAALMKPAAPAGAPPLVAAQRGEAAASAGPAREAPHVAATVPMLAYQYNYAVTAPAKAIRTLVGRHEAACLDAGPTVCQITALSVSEVGDDELRGTLSMRAEPGWLRRFRDGLPSAASAAGGRIKGSSATSEDLSRQIVDTEAAIRARTTLRDRLEALLASRPGKLSELLELEQQLARVQGEIDATQSELAVMRGRVATSALTLQYESTGVLAPQGVWSPLGDAVHDILGSLVVALAVMVRIATFLAPWALVIGAGLWLFRKRLPWRRPKGPWTRPPPAA